MWWKSIHESLDLRLMHSDLQREMVIPLHKNTYLIPLTWLKLLIHPLISYPVFFSSDNTDNLIWVIMWSVSVCASAIGRHASPQHYTNARNTTKYGLSGLGASCWNEHFYLFCFTIVLNFMNFAWYSDIFIG